MNHKLLLHLLIGSAVLAMTTPARAGTSPKAPEFEGDTSAVPSAESAPYNKDDYQKQMAAANDRANRTIASASNYESEMSDALKKLRADLLSVHTSDELDQKLKALSAAMDAVDKSDLAAGVTNRSPYKGADRDFRFYAAQIVPLQCLKGIVWRFTPLAEKSGVVESRLVTEVYRISRAMQILTPQAGDLASPDARAQATADGDHSIAQSVFDYMTKPYNGAVLFAEGYDLQEHMMNSCYAALNKSAQRIDRIDLSTPIVWDNKMYFGVGSFPDDLDRYKLIGEAERHFSLAMKSAGMSFISFFRSYSIKDYFRLQTELGKLYVQDAFPSIFGGGYQTINGVSLQKRAAVIRSFGSTFILYADGAKYMRSYAWPNLVRSVQELNIVWAQVKDKPENQRMVINPAFLNAFHRGTDDTLRTWNGVIAGRSALHSRLTDRTVVFDLQNFYNNPVSDLKSFLPLADGFDNAGPRYLTNNLQTSVLDLKTRKPIDVSKKYAKARNWYFGEPKNWDASAWRVVFPELASGKDVPLLMRTVKETWGGDVIALPLMQFLR